MLKIVTWNVNSVASRLDRLLAFLQRSSPDVVCLQELKCVAEKFPYAALAAAGYEAAVFGQKTYNGVAILSRTDGAATSAQPPKIQCGFDDGVDDPAARFISIKTHGVTVMSAYVPNGQEVGSDKYFYKLNWLARLRRYLERAHQPGEPLILVGDFNVAPTDLDVHDPNAWHEKILCSTAEREALAQIMEFGFTDTFRQLYPDKAQFTWWDYRMMGFPRNHGMRIDFILATAPLLPRLHDCVVDRDERKGDKPSDHAPVLAMFR